MSKSRRSFPWIVACIVLLSVSAPCRSQAPANHDANDKTHVIWTGASAGLFWKWTTADLTATATDSKTYTLSALGYEKRTSQMMKDEKADPFDSLVECKIQPLSIVGSIACYERDYYWEGGAHPSGSIDLVVLDVKQPDRRLALTDLFPDADILRALMSDKVVQGTLKRNSLTNKPMRAGDLVKLLSGRTFGGDDDMRYGFEPDLLYRFAFHHIEGDRIAIRINISWASEIYRFTSTQIGILLPIPPALRKQLTAADNRTSGFLMRDAMKLANGKETTLFTLKAK